MSTTLQDVLQQVQGMDRIRMDYKANASDLFVSDTGQVGIGDTGVYEPVTGQFDASGPAPLYMTAHALGQMASRLGIKYGRAFFGNNPTLPQHVIADTLNHFTAANPDKEFLIRQFSGNIHGVLGHNYLIMDHSWLVQQGLFFLTDPNTGALRGHRVTRSNISPDYMCVDVIFHEFNPNGGSDGTYGLGFSLRNGTVGNASAGVVGLTKRGACDNAIRERRSEWTLRHVGSTDLLATREVLIITALVEATHASVELAEGMIRARKQRLPNVFDVIGDLLESQKLSLDLAPIVGAGTEGENTLAGLINGLTFATHHESAKDLIAPETAEDIEALAGAFVRNHADGETEGDTLAKALFSTARSRAHVEVADDLG